MPGEGPGLWLGAACKARTETAYKAEGCEASWHMTAKPTGTRLAGRSGYPIGRHGCKFRNAYDAMTEAAMPERKP